MKQKFTVQKSILLDALTVTGKGITNSILPILQSYLFVINNDEISITAGNMEVFLTTKIDISGNGFSRPIAIPAKRLIDLIKELPEQGLEFTIEDREVDERTVSNIKIIASSGKYVIPVEDGKDFPKIEVKDPLTFPLPSESLMLGIDRSLFACLAEPGQVLEGVLMSFENNEVTYTGCDGQIMGTVSLPLDDELSTKNSFVIPNRVLSIIRTLSSSEVINIMVSDRSIQFEMDDKTIVQSILVAGSYPDYKSIIPINNEKHLFIDRNLLLGSLKRVRQFSNLGTTLVVLDIDNQKCLVNSNNEMSESASEEINIDYAGEPIKICINGNKLISCLTKYGTDQVHFSISSGKRGIIIREDNDDLTALTNLMLVMPFALPD